MADEMGDAVMRGFLWHKALIARYGVEQTAGLLFLAGRTVDEGLYSNRREAVEAIEKHFLEVSVTTPVSEEVASYTTRRP